MYCRFGNFRENFIFANGIKRHISDVKNSQLRQDLPISGSTINGDLVYTIKRIIGKPNLSDQFKTITKRYKKKLGIAWISSHNLHAWLNPITVYSYSCTTVSLASDSMTALT